MALIRWEPARELQSVQQEMNRLFGTFFDSPTAAGNGGSRRWIPAMDLVEEGDHYVLRADLPGVSEDDVKVELEDSVLTISGERTSEHEQRKEGYYRVERASGAFSRSLALPEVRAGEPEGLVKVVFDKKTGAMLGAHMIGAEVTELIQGYVVAMNLETTEEELMHTIFPHPTLSEMMKEAVLDAYGRVLNI